jgi:hypothetical protein
MNVYKEAYLSDAIRELSQVFKQRVNDINKAQAHTVYKLARALYCKVEDLLEDPQSV